MKLGSLKAWLQGYQNKDYLLDGFTRGFRLEYNGPRSAMTSKNLKSCEDSPEIVFKKISTEVKAGRVKGPFSYPPFHNLKVSPIGIVPKKTPGQFRLIHHLSYPKNHSVNFFIDPDFASVQYTSFDDAVKNLVSLGKNTNMAKTDVDSAFRLIPVNPKDHPLLGFKFQGKYYYDSCLPFGASSSCAIFETFSTALEWVAKHKLGIQYIIHILDDFLIFDSPGKNDCNSSLQKFISMCTDLGVPINEEKTEYATTCITFMGLELDSVAMEARLPFEKLEKLRNLLSRYSRARKIKLRELQSLLGLLNFCCRVVLPGRCFLRRLYDLTKSVSKPYHRVTLNKESRRDIKAWQIFVDHFNGKQILQEKRWITSESLEFYTDAAGSLGFGAVFRTHWFYGPWPKDMEKFNITWKELFPIVLALEVWGPMLKNSCITLHSDNYAVVYILNKQTSKDQDIMYLVRRHVLCCMKYNLLIKAVHVPGRLNVLPDLLSRLQVSKFHTAAPWMDSQPTQVSQQLLRTV